MVAFNLEVPEPLLVDTEKGARKLLELVGRKIERDPMDFIGFDSETNALKIPLKLKKNGEPQKNNPLDWMKDTITFWSMSFKLDQYQRWCILGQYLWMFTGVLENPKANIVTWNGKYDAHVAWNSGIDVWNSNYMDCMAMAALVDENLHGQLDLKSSAKRIDGFAGRDQALRKMTEDGHLTPWVPVQMTKFKDLFGVKDARGNRIEEYVTSLYDLPVEKVSNYASLDAYVTLRLAEHLYELLSVIPIDEDYSMWNYYVDIEKDITMVLWRMERRGMGVDRKYLKKLIKPLDEELARIHKKICELAGWYVDIHKAAQLRRLFFGTREEGGLGLRPIKMTKGGATLPVPSTDDSVLELICMHKQGKKSAKIAGLIRRWRTVDKIKGTYAVALYKLSGWFEDGRIHPNFKQAEARTGRLSATTPNSMNMPRPDTDEFKIRKAFIARKGKKLVVVDLEQAEMRIMAHFSQDPGMLEAIRNNLDLHCVTVEKMYGIPYDEVKAAKSIGNINEKNPLTEAIIQKLIDLGESCPCELAELARKVEEGLEAATASEELAHRISELLLKRQGCKTIGFAIIYGAGAANISQQLEISKEEAQEKIDAYFHAYPKVKDFIESTHAECRHEEFVTTLLGRRRRLPDINSHVFSKYAHAERESVNAIIQGSASEMVKCAMILIELDEELNALGYEMIDQIHDELIGEAPEENAERCCEIVKRHMEYPINGQPALCIPVPANGVVVDSWDQAK